MCGSNEELPAVWQIAMEEQRNYKTTYQQLSNELFQWVRCSLWVQQFCEKENHCFFFGASFWGMVGRTISRWPMKSSSFVSWKALIVSFIEVGCKLEGFHRQHPGTWKWCFFSQWNPLTLQGLIFKFHIKLQGCSFLADFFIFFASESLRIWYKNVHNIMFHQRCGVAVAPSNAIGDDMSQQSNLKFPIMSSLWNWSIFPIHGSVKRDPDLEDPTRLAKASENIKYQTTPVFQRVQQEDFHGFSLHSFCLALLIGNSVPEKLSFFIGFWSLQRQKGHFCAFLNLNS